MLVRTEAITEPDIFIYLAGIPFLPVLLDGFMALMQTRRHGGHTGAVPPQMTACAPQARTVPRRN